MHAPADSVPLLIVSHHIISLETLYMLQARHLAKVHHKNLVTLIGYCKDRKHLGLVYEYMDGGNLENYLKGSRFLHSIDIFIFEVALD
jgi:serine/threonine protein kinase